MFESSPFNLMEQFMKPFISPFNNPVNNPVFQMMQASMKQMTGPDQEAFFSWQRLFQGNGQGGGTSSLRFEELAKNLFKTSMNAYEQDFSKIYKMPQLGLTRTYQDRINRCMDEFNRFAMEMGQFNTMLASPMGKAFVELEENLSVKPDHDPQEIYRQWLQILEKRYLELFQSTDFIHTLHRVVMQYSSLQELQDHLFKDLLKYSPVSSKEDFDEVAKENYKLKKEVRQIKKQVHALEKKINAVLS